MGRHKEITCPQCGYVYAVNASEEVECSSRRAAGSRVVLGASASTAGIQARVDDEPSFKGDRILVMKFPYDLPFLPGSSAPQRWDVVVFRYPEEPEVSYIKRLVGLPGEELRVDSRRHLHQAARRRRTFQLARKPLLHQQAMQMMVYDDTHRPRALAGQPGVAALGATTPGAWTRRSRRGSFAPRPRRRPSWTELRYRHLVPDPEQWEAILDRRELPRPPAPDADHRLLLVQHQHVGRLRDPTTPGGDQDGPGCSRTGSAT